MSVYVIAQITIRDRERYQLYEDQFMEVFEQFDGTLLSVDEDPVVLEGEWTATRSVLIEFPDTEAAKAWLRSDAYSEIAQHRLAASTGNAILVAGLE